MEDKDSTVNSFRKWNLAIAEAIDAWRVVPRLLVAAYGVLVGYLTYWYFAQPTYPKTQCSAEVLKALLEKNLPLDKAQEIACTIVDVVGGPTASQSAVVGTIVGLSTAIFGFYVNTGKDWSKSILPWKFGNVKEDNETEVK